MQKVALVYDWADKFGGAERLLLALHQVFPQAPIYTSVYDQDRASWAREFPAVFPSWLTRISQRHELVYPLIPIAFETFDFSQYDLVVSVTSAFAKGIVTKPSTIHICYCLAPTRFLWQDAALYRENIPLILRPAWDLISSYLRFWDKIVANRPDYYVSISDYTGALVKQVYKRPVLKTIHPPVDLQTFRPGTSKRKDFYLVVSRLVPYKRIDIVVKAFNHLGLKLIIVGDGSERAKLEGISRSNITFLGFRPEKEVVQLLSQAKALIHPQKEDFGLTVLEANACGTPVLAFAKGGATETIQPGESGIFFNHQTPEAIIDAIRSTDFSQFSPEACRKNAERFSLTTFEGKWHTLLGDILIHK